VKAITSAVLSAVGNLVCQLFVEQKTDVDWKRFNTFTGLGFFFVAPALHFWFGTLNKLVPNPGTQGDEQQGLTRCGGSERCSCCVLLDVGAW